MKITNLLAIVTTLVIGMHSTESNSAPYSTPNYYQCYNKIGGSWNFGRVPNACDVNPWGDPQYVEDKFTPVVFNDSNPSGTSAERNRYMNELHAMLRDSVAYYIQQRKPSVSASDAFSPSKREVLLISIPRLEKSETSALPSMKRSSVISISV